MDMRHYKNNSLINRAVYLSIIHPNNLPRALVSKPYEGAFLLLSNRENLLFNTLRKRESSASFVHESLCLKAILLLQDACRKAPKKQANGRIGRYA